MTEEMRHQINEKHLTRLHPTLARKVRAILQDLEGHDWMPVIGSSWRSRAEQLAIYKAGNSKVTFSFHNATLDGHPCSLAADITDKRYGWDIPLDHPFWRHLGSSAHAHSLVWGGDWIHFKDVAHVQLLENSFLAKVRKGWLPPIT